jgi:hypothetical protein
VTGNIIILYYKIIIIFVLLSFLYFQMFTATL